MILALTNPQVGSIAGAICGLLLGIAFWIAWD